MEAIIAQLFTVRNDAHEFHLSTHSFAAHVALGDFYEDIIPLIDDFAESYQGKYGIIDFTKISPLVSFNKSGPMAYFHDLAVWAEAQRSLISPADTHLLNDWDMIVSLIYKTKYKLERLV